MKQIIDLQVMMMGQIPLKQLLTMLPRTWSGTRMGMVVTFMLLWRGLKTPAQSGKEKLWMAKFRPSIITLGVFS